MNIILFSSIFIIISLAAICNKFMDKWMVKYQLLSDKKELELNPSWFSYNPLAKWHNNKWGTKRAYNILLLKLRIKTTWLADNCNDSWHFLKSIMIVLLCSNVVLALILGALVGLLPWYCYPLFLILFGIQWNLTFNKTESQTFK